MFRIPRHLMNVRRITKYHQHIHETNLKVSNYPPRGYSPQEREPCPPPDPPPPRKPREDRAFWGAMTVVVLAAGFTVYAKRHPEVRDWLSMHAPWFDDFIATVYRENISYQESAWKLMENMKKFIYCNLLDDKPKICPDDNITPKLAENDVPKIENEDDTCAEPVEVVTYDICSVIDCAQDRGDIALKNYHTAMTACNMYNTAVEEIMQDYGMTSGKALHDHMVERRKIVNRSVRCAEDACTDLHGLLRYLEGGVQAPEEDIENVRMLIREYQQKIKASLIKYEWANDKSLILDQLWMKVQHGLSKYVRETETMFPEVSYAQNKLVLSGDMDLLLHHSSRYTKYLKHKLDEASAGMTERINRSMDFLPQGEKKKLRDGTIQASVLFQRDELKKEFQQKYEHLNKKNDKILADSLKAQNERHEKDLEIKLELKEKTATEKLNKMVAEKVAYENNMMKYQLEEMAHKVDLVEKKLLASLNAEKEAKRSRELYQAGVALLKATKKGDNYVKVDKELKAIEKVADGDKLVTTLLNAIPPSVLEKGLVPESVLKKRYQQMEQTALKVALVEGEGSPLPVFVLSWFQAALLQMKLSGIPQEEYDKPGEAPLEDLDTFDLLQRARFWLERGNLAAAIRYVDSMEGASRVAAMSWHEAALAHLETRQAAEALLAYAVSIGLLYM